MNYTSKEIIKRLLAHDNPIRFGYDFNGLSDIQMTSSRVYVNLPKNPYSTWGNYPELSSLTGFYGETRRDVYGNIYGRFEGKTKGECIRGVIQDWDECKYYIPDFDKNYREQLLSKNFAANDRFVMASGGALFSALRDARLMPNALADTITETEAVVDFLDRVAEHEIAIIKSVAGCGIDGWIIYDDWGTQDRTFISPASFQAIFKPAYKKVVDAVHEAGMSMFLHSCGYNYEFMEDFIDIGIDALNFDQPDAYPTEVLAREFADRVVFYSPVDIQKVLPTGNRELIESRTLEMCRLFREAGGGWIAKDYPSYEDIGIDPEWARLAQNIIMANSKL